LTSSDLVGQPAPLAQGLAYVRDRIHLTPAGLY